MPINKIDRKELKEMVVDILGKSATFKLLSNDDEINPCRISFDGMEFYIYIKNLSPAQLSNNNPDIWRIQLPIRDDFNRLKDDDIPFVALGYDDENKVFTTWNPYWVKQRLNAAKSVSLYSRFSLQQIANETQLPQKLNLNNDGEVVAFPSPKLGYYLVNIKQYFPEMTEYVAMGSRKRAEANAAFHCLCDSKNITEYARYLASAEYSDTTISNYCRAIRKLISDGYFSRNRKIFLACDSLTEYPTVINTFLEVPEIFELNEAYHRQISNGLRTYIQYLLEINNLNDDVDAFDEEPQDDVEVVETDAEQTATENENIDWEALFTDENGRLTRIANPQLIDLLRPALDTEYRKLSVAYHIISEFYGDRFQNSMELKDWNYLFNQINWQSPYYIPVEQQIERTQKHKSHILKVTTPDGQVFCERKVAETLVAVIKYAGVERVWDMNINVCANNMIVFEEDINPRYAVATKYVDEGLYANTCCDTPTKASIIQQISDTLKLDLVVEFVSIDGSSREPAPARPLSNSNRQKIKVTFPDGKVIRHSVVSDTFIEVIRYAGAEKVRNLHINVIGNNLIVSKSQINPKYIVSTKWVEGDWYCSTNISTTKKAEILEQISDSLGLGLIVEQV